VVFLKNVGKDISYNRSIRLHAELRLMVKPLQRGSLAPAENLRASSTLGKSSFELVVVVLNFCGTTTF
jgi:hypothetical protein